MQSWTIKQLYEAMEQDLNKCQTSHERIMVKAICGKEIREKAYEWVKERKLTPIEVSIAQGFGYKGA